MSAHEDPWFTLAELGWALSGDNTARQTPADHRPETEAWVDSEGYVSIGEPGDEDTELSSDFVMEVSQ